MMVGFVSFAVDPGTGVWAGPQMAAYDRDMGAATIKVVVRTSPSGALPTSLYVRSFIERLKVGHQPLVMFDRAFRPTRPESPDFFPNMKPNSTGNRSTSPWVDGFTLRSGTFLRAVNKQLPTDQRLRRAICWNEGDQLALLVPGTNVDPLSLKANALSPAAFAFLCWQAAIRWRSLAGIERTYCGGLSVLPQSGLDPRNPYVALYMRECYKSLIDVGLDRRPPKGKARGSWPWAGWVMNCEGWWTTAHLEAAITDVQGVMAEFGDQGEIIVGEFLTTNKDFADHPSLLRPTLNAFRGSGLECYAFQAPGRVPYLGPPSSYDAEGLYQWRNVGGQFVAGPDYPLGAALRLLLGQ